MSAAGDIYNLSGGRVVLSGKIVGASSGSGLAYAAYNWSTQGARDAENNAIYDTARRFERTMAVLSAAGETYEEKKVANTFTSTDWGDAEYAAHLAKLGFGDSKRQEAERMLRSAEWQVLSGVKAGSPIHLKYEELTQRQFQQLAATGTFVHEGQTIVASSGASGMRDALQAAAGERNRTDRMFHPTDHKQARYSMQQIAQGQKKLLSDISARNGGEMFRGTTKDVRNLEKVLLRERENRIRMGLNTDSIDADIKDVRIAKKTGLAHDADYGAASAQRRSYGRQIIVSQVAGDEMNRGIVFYTQAYKLTKQSAALAARATLGGGAKAASKAAAAVSTLAKGTELGRRADLFKVSADNLHDKANRIGRKSKEEKRENREQRRDKNREKRRMRFHETGLRLDKEIAVLENKKTGRPGKPGHLTAREQAKLERLTKRRKCHTKRGGRLNARDVRRAALRRRIAAVGSVTNKIQIVLSKLNPISATARFISYVQKKAAIMLGTFMLVFVAFLIVCSGFVCIVPVIASFASSIVDAATGFFDGGQNAEDINYVQQIVNETARDLVAQFESVAKNDAVQHFLIDDPVPSNNGIEWYKTVSEGDIGHIWASDEMNLPETQRRELSGFSANLLQITSLMHYRYQDELGFDEYNTAKAYVYYMFVRTHRVAEDAAGNRAYGYEDLDDHDNSVLYSTPVSYDPGTQMVTRGDELCENVYVHGYHTINAGGGNLASAINRARAEMEGFLTSCVRDIATANGIVPGASGGQAQGLWLNEKPHDDVGICNNYTAYPAGYGDGFLYTTDRGGDCPGHEHTHSEDCFIFVETGGYYEDGVTLRGYSQLICGQEEHTHDPWHSEYDSGCYQTVYVCNGHCGGHMSPTVDVEIDMAWEDIMQYDDFETPYFIRGSDAPFTSILDWSRCRTIEAWAEKWMAKASGWFALRGGATGQASAWLGIPLAYTGPTEPDGSTEDIYDFDGWLNDDGTLDTGLLADVNSFYGTYETNFEDGIQMWRDFEVVFPAGSGQTLTESQIQDVLEQVRMANPGISERRLLVLEEALRGVGQYYYSLTGAAHQNAVHNTSGAGECSGFVSGVLNRALGTNYDTNAAGYYSYGSAGTLSAGDVIAFTTTGGRASGHVLFYVGNLPDGVAGYATTGPGGTVDQSGNGTFVIDCTPSCGGSVIRKYSDFSRMHGWGGY